jgi:hypothetical protein
LGRAIGACANVCILALAKRVALCQTLSGVGCRDICDAAVCQDKIELNIGFDLNASLIFRLLSNGRMTIKSCILNGQASFQNALSNRRASSNGRPALANERICWMNN